MPDRTIQRHDGRDGSVYFFCAFFFVGLDIPGRIGADRHVVHHPAQHRVAAVGQLSFQRQLQQFLGGRRHILVALTEGYHRKAQFLQILRHLHRAPAVKGNLADVVLRAQLFDEFLDVAIVNNIALRGVYQTLLRPCIIGHVIPAHAQVNRILRQPEERQNFVFTFIIFRRKHQHESRNVRGTGKVEPAIAHPPAQPLRIDRIGAGVPFVHGHPAGGGARPLAQVELPKLHFLGGILLRAFTGRLVILDVHSLTQRRIHRLPDLRVCPVRVRGRGIHHRVEGGIVLAALQNVQRLGMHLIADRILVASRRGNDEVQRLLSGRAGALRHNVKQLSVGLAQQLVEDTGMNVVAVLGRNLRGQHLINSASRQIHEAFLALHNLDALEQRRALQHHILSHVEYDASLLPVVGAAVNLRAFLAVARQHIQRHGGGQLALAGFFADFHEGRVELPVAVGLDGAEQVADDLLLPVEQQERLPGPHALGVLQGLNEIDGVIGALLVVVRGGQHEFRGLILLSAGHVCRLPSGNSAVHTRQTAAGPRSPASEPPVRHPETAPDDACAHGDECTPRSIRARGRSSRRYSRWCWCGGASG